MAYTIHVDVVSAEDSIFSGLAEMVFVPATLGEVGITPHHAPVLTLMKSGDVRIKQPNGKQVSFFVSGGVFEVQPHRVTVLSDTVLRADEIDEKEALEAKKRAEEALAGKREQMTYEQARAELAEALAKLRVLKLMKDSPVG